MKPTRSCLAALAVIAALTGLVAPAGDLIYFEEDGGAGNPRGLYDFDSGTGGSSLRTTVDAGPRFFSLARRPSDGQVFAMHPIGSVLYKLDLDTGAFQLVANTGLDTIADIAFDPMTDEMYGLGRNTSLFYRIDPDSGSSQLIANIAPIRSGITFSPDGMMYGLTVFDGDLYTIDPTTGGIAFVGSSGPDPGTIEDAGITPDGRMFFTDFGGTLYEIDTQTGARATVGSTGMGTGLVGLINTDPFTACDPCDANCDGDVNTLDIQPFVDLVLGGSSACDTCTGDTNGDGSVNVLDIEGFVDCLIP
jgi:hypothetical protein